MNQPIGPLALARLMFCAPFIVMLVLMLIEASLSAATTYFVITAGRDVAKGTFLLADLMWILAAQSAAYVVGAVSWIFAERTGFLAYARYMLRFARDNRHKTKLLGDKEARERVEPFLTGETFYVYFHLLYEIEGDLRILLALILNVIVLGTQIDGALPVAYVAVFVVLFLMQWTMRKRVAGAYRENQRMTNRMTAQGYTAWDNVFAGNRYNLRLWLGGFNLIFHGFGRLHVFGLSCIGFFLLGLHFRLGRRLLFGLLSQVRRGSSLRDAGRRAGSGENGGGCRLGRRSCHPPEK